MAFDWKEELRRMPWWATGTLLFSAFMTFVYVPWDLFWKPAALDEEVWFGVVFHGFAAKLLEPPHWIVYAAITWGLWRQKSWAGALCALYIAQVALSMLIWNVIDERGMGWIAGLVSGAPFGVLTWAFWSNRERLWARDE